MLRLKKILRSLSQETCFYLLTKLSPLSLFELFLAGFHIDLRFLQKDRRTYTTGRDRFSFLYGENVVTRQFPVLLRYKWKVYIFCPTPHWNIDWLLHFFRIWLTFLNNAVRVISAFTMPRLWFGVSHFLAIPLVYICDIAIRTEVRKLDTALCLSTAGSSFDTPENTSLCYTAY